MLFKTALAYGRKPVRILGFWLVFVIFAAGPVNADCGKAPDELAAGLPATSDPVLHMTLLMKAMDECGTGTHFDLMLNRHALAIGDDATDRDALTGTWISDIWLPVALGHSPAMIDVLSVDDNKISQSLYRWFDPQKSQIPEVFPDYVLNLATAIVETTSHGRLAIVGTQSSDQISPYNRYRPSEGSEADKFQHAMTSFMTMDLGKIANIRVAGDHLLLVDKGGNVRSFVRIEPDILNGGHALVLIANIAASRTWPCVVGVLRGTTGTEQSRDRFIAASRVALQALRLREEVLAQQRLLKEAKIKSADFAQLERNLKAKQESLIALANGPEIVAVIELFQGKNLPEICLSE